MRSINYDQAKKVIEKYLVILTAKQNDHLNVKNVNAVHTKKGDSKVIVQVITEDGNSEDLDNFCLRHEIEYDILM